MQTRSPHRRVLLSTLDDRLGPEPDQHDTTRHVEGPRSDRMQLTVSTEEGQVFNLEVKIGEIARQPIRRAKRLTV